MHSARPFSIVGHTARGTTARHEARFFSPTRAWHGPVTYGSGLARPEAAGRAWAAAQARGLARHGTARPESAGPATPLKGPNG